MNLSRRAFVSNGSTLIATAAVCRVAWSDSPMLPESDPTAAALGYKANATSVDHAKYPSYAAGQTCESCVLYQGAPGRPSGGCALFAGKLVAAKGWCSSYSKKP